MVNLPELLVIGEGMFKLLAIQFLVFSLAENLIESKNLESLISLSSFKVSVMVLKLIAELQVDSFPNSLTKLDNFSNMGEGDSATKS